MVKKASHWNIFFRHLVDTLMHLWDKKKYRHRNTMKTGFLSENAMKEDERVLLHPQVESDIRSFWHFNWPSALKLQIFSPKSSLLSQFLNSKDWRLYWASKGPFFGEEEELRNLVVGYRPPTWGSPHCYRNCHPDQGCYKLLPHRRQGWMPIIWNCESLLGQFVNIRNKWQ